MSKQTTPETPVFVTPWSLEEIGRAGRANIPVHAHGYWSDVITVYASADYVYEKGATDDTITFKWKFTISHSSGGRDTAEVAEDWQAETYFAHALLTAVAVSKQLQDAEPQLDALYAEERARRRAEHEAEQAAKQARIDADPALGEAAAKRLVKQLWARAELDGEANVALFRRGSDENPVHVSVTKARHSGVITARVSGDRVGRLDLPARLGALSAREFKVQA